ncbi:IclR family transcriptional regulator [Aeromicrobium terrae]|uniref:Helix-turn-helix domain-containing protein n=1 Tax=Aeromicrobium terrae TaxID=2498846 RepID=A0A5C8NNK9_9ACTN|nr:helix-turn-helix domain-containing protein [Aeromicrobium terrae]TXL62680.1 helix-turn-helix domain-containing protein [Aeromicrobium terrae]
MAEGESEQPSTAREQDIQAVSRTAQILGLFAPETPELSVAEATKRLGLNRTTVHRYFSSMISSGLLERVDDSPLVRPGRAVLQLGSFALGQQRIMQLAPAYMRELALDIKVSTVLSLWGISGPVVSLVEEADHPTLVTVRVGSQLALNSSQAKVFLAFLPDQFHADRMTGSLPEPQRTETRNRIQAVREAGISSDVNHRGICILAAPVFAANGICATIAAVGTERMLPAALDSREALALKDACQRLTKEMGGTWPEDS